MAAYAAVISLKHTINSLRNSSRLSPISSTLEKLKAAYDGATSLQQVLEILSDSSKRLDGLEGKIRDAAYKLEDVLEEYESNTKLYSQEEDEEVGEQMSTFAKIVKKVEREYSEVCRDDEDNDEDAAIVSSHIDFGVEMVGHSHTFNTIRNDLLRVMRPNDLCFVSFYGEIGSGRTVVAKNVYEDLREGREQLYDCYVWVTLPLGTTHEQFKEVVIRILAQVEGDRVAADVVHEFLLLADNAFISYYLYKTLEHRRYLIVLDDVHDMLLLTYLRRSFPDKSNGSLVFITTNQEEVALLAEHVHSYISTGREVANWMFLRMCVFPLGDVSPESEEALKNIFYHCRGLTLPYYRVLLLLLRSNKKVEQLRNIAADEENPIFMVADEISEMSEIKREILSYNSDMGDKADIIVTRIPDIFDAFVKGVKMMIKPERFFCKMQIISLWGMKGIGKSTIAKKIIQDEAILSHFDHCVWVTLGPKYQAEEILLDILAQIYPAMDKMDMKEDDKLAEYLCLQLSAKRCLIIVDDLWSKDPLQYLKKLFPDIKGTTLVTTTLSDVAKFGRDDIDVEIKLLDDKESWSLLCQKVFAEGNCPFELEKAGRKIAELCEGLPLLILTVADQLLKVEMSKEYWNNVASGKEKSVFMNAHRQISKALLPSYLSLPQHLRMFFLYIGVFRPKFKIPTSTFINLLDAEGFLETERHQTIEKYVAECLSKLFQRSLVMVQRKTGFDFEYKTCRLHAVFWHLANSEAAKSKFYHAMNCYADCSVLETMRSQRRLCIRNNILLGIKDVQNSMASITSARSLLCVNPFEQYPVPIDFGMRLLRVMNAVTIRLYEFPVEVVRLLHLKYIALTCNGKLPTSLPNLWKLQYLIVKRHMTIKSSKNSNPLPVEIWDMKELKHLQIMGGCLPNPKHGAALLKLSTLSDVSARSCTKKALKCMPNLKRLGIRIELAPDDDGNSFRYLNNIHCLERLESLKCAVVNPHIRHGVVPPVFKIPSNLQRLSLSGFGYPWEYFNGMIGGLSNLEVLKLKQYAFQGPKWEMDQFARLDKLKSISVEDTNLVQWKLKVPISNCPMHLSFKHCYKLQELPVSMYVYTAKNIEIVRCSPSTVTWAHQVEPSLTDCKVKVRLLWDADTNEE